MVRHEKPGGPTEYSCKLQLPCNAPFETLEGPICSSMRLAQQACYHFIIVMLASPQRHTRLLTYFLLSYAGCMFGCLQEAP